MTDKERIRLKERFIKVYQKNAGNISATCKACKIDRRTVYNWRCEDEKFQAQLAEIDEKNIDIAETALMNLVIKGYFPAIKFLLSTKGKERGYATKIEIETLNDYEPPVTIITEKANEK